MQIEENVSLAPFTTFGIGGKARYFVRVQTVEDLKEAQKFATDNSVPIFVLGGGSNVLIADGGFAGLVVKIELMGIEIQPIMETPLSALLVVAAGESWDAVVERAVGENLWGIENLSGIPGTFGGAVVQNIGAYGQAISEVVDWVEVLDISTGETKKFTAKECGFDYRDSIFKHNPNLVVVRAAIRLSKSKNPNLSYRDLRQRFPGGDTALEEIRSAVLAIRKDKFPDLEVEGTAGSFFKNPMVLGASAEALRAKYPGMPLFDMPETNAVKVPLAWLLDHVLHLNGFRLGTARLFERQPIVITSDQGALAADVLALAHEVRTRVREACGFEIEEEVRIVP